MEYNQDKIKLGSVVRLKTGGTEMVVDNILSNELADSVKGLLPTHPHPHTGKPVANLKPAQPGNPNAIYHCIWFSREVTEEYRCSESGDKPRELFLRLSSLRHIRD